MLNIIFSLKYILFLKTLHTAYKKHMLVEFTNISTQTWDSEGQINDSHL